MIQHRNSDLDLEEKFTRESNRLKESSSTESQRRIAKCLAPLGRMSSEKVCDERRIVRHARWNFSRRVTDKTSMKSLMMRFLSRMRVRSFWLRTLSFIHCASIICCPLSVGRTLPTFQMEK